MCICIKYKANKILEYIGMYLCIYTFLYLNYKVYLAVYRYKCEKIYVYICLFYCIDRYICKTLTKTA